MIQQNDAENFVTRLGAIRAGVIPAHININKFSHNNVHNYLKMVEPHGVVLTPKYDVTKVIDVINENLPDIPQNYVIGHPLKIEEHQYLKILFHTHKSKHYDGWYSLKDLFWYDESPRTVAPAVISPNDTAEIHFTRFTPDLLCPITFSHRSVVQSALNFGSVAPFLGKRVAIAGEYCHPEIQTSMLSCMGFGAFFINSSFWFRATQFLKDLKTQHINVIIVTPTYLRELVDHPLAEQNTLETILVMNNPKDFASASLLQSAKNVFSAKNVESCFITDGCIAPFLYSSQADDNLMGSNIPNSRSFILGEDGKEAAPGTIGRLVTSGDHVAKEITVPQNIPGQKSADAYKKTLSEGNLDTGLKAFMKDGQFFLC
mmetsp:Transcript_61794/g.93326  ORF Transcript_61794/g.93326 Transcript_61794/m.93326 type:complete len:373 (-) Transcript_61794:111-1229(-)